MMWLLRDRLTAIMLLLWAITIASWSIGHGHSGGPVATATIAVLASAAIKARFVIRDFMEVRAAPRALGVGLDAWLTILTAILVGLVLLSPEIRP